MPRPAACTPLRACALVALALALTAHPSWGARLPATAAGSTISGSKQPAVAPGAASKERRSGDGAGDLLGTRRSLAPTHAGYLPVEEEGRSESAIYYAYFESQEERSNANTPIVLWLQASGTVGTAWALSCVRGRAAWHWHQWPKP